MSPHALNLASLCASIYTALHKSKNLRPRAVKKCEYEHQRTMETSSGESTPKKHARHGSGRGQWNLLMSLACLLFLFFVINRSGITGSRILLDASIIFIEIHSLALGLLNEAFAILSYQPHLSGRLLRYTIWIKSLFHVQRSKGFVRSHLPSSDTLKRLKLISTYPD